MSNKKRFLLTILFCFFTTGSCSTNYDVGDQCINTFQDYSFAPLSEQHINPVLPLAPWVIEGKLPENDSLIPYKLELVRTLNETTEIWIKTKLSCDVCNSGRDADYYYFLIYKTDTKKWSTIPALIEGSIVYAHDIFLDNDGSIWARNTWDIYLSSGVDNNSENYNGSRYHDIPLLSKYNDSTERFEFVETPQHIPIIGKENSNGIITLNEILIDESGIFWIFVHQDGIYKYDPIANHISRKVGIPDIDVNIKSIAPNGDIYFGYANDMSKYLDVDLYRYNPESGTVFSVELPEGKWPHISNILIDNNGQLWLDLIVMRDINNDWQKIYPHPWRYSFGLRWDFHKWAELPRIVTESTNGKIWLRHGSKGMAWYDPNQENGCWFTTVSTHIIEDDQNNLWLTADGKLYKLPTESQ